MGSEWQSTSLGNVIELKRGYDLPKRLRTHGEIALISSAGVSDSHSESKVKGPGVVTGRYGTIGKVFFSPDDFWPLNTTLYVRDFKGNDPKFIFYFLKTLNFHEFSDKAAVPGVNRNHLHMAKVCVPSSVPEQKAIAHILGSLDDKIELNRRMNATLEGMAQALFKSRFVDFDPVLDNAIRAGNAIPEEFAARAEARRSILDQNQKDECSVLNDELRTSKIQDLPKASHSSFKTHYSAFPSKFTLTDTMGWIPEGWEEGTIGNIAKAIGGFAFKSQVFLDSGFPVVKIKNIVGDGTVSIEGAQCIGTEDATKALNFSLNDGDLLMAMTGATVGKIGLVVNEERRAFLNQRVAKLSGKSVENFSSFLFCFFKEQSNFNQIIGTAGGSAQPNISSSGIESVACVIPTIDLLDGFTKLVDPWFEKWISNYKQTKSLSKLRDTQLPKLISGEFRVSEVEQLTKKTLA